MAHAPASDEAFSAYHCRPQLVAANVVKLTRTEASFPDAAAVREETRRVSEALDRLGRSGRSLLVDARLAPHNTDGRLREEFFDMRVAIRRDFGRTAVLVRSKIGILQAARLSTEDGIRSTESVFDDEATAIAHLRESYDSGF